MIDSDIGWNVFQYIVYTVRIDLVYTVLVGTFESDFSTNPLGHYTIKIELMPTIYFVAGSKNNKDRD